MPTDQSASTSQADSKPHEHEAIIVDNGNDGATDGAAPSAKASGKWKVHPPSMEDQHLILTHDGSISHTNTSCNNCHKFHNHIHCSHASEKHAALCHVYHKRNSAQVLQEEFDGGRTEEHNCALEAIKECNAQYDKLCDKLDKVCTELAHIIGTVGMSSSPMPTSGLRAPSRCSLMKNPRASALAKSTPDPGVIDTSPAPTANAPIADHIAYFRQRPKTQPPWLSATLASAGEALDSVDIDTVWNHSLVTGAVSRWLILIGTVARGSFWLTPAALIEHIVPLLGNPWSNNHYVAFVQQHIPTFDGWRPANFMFWCTSCKEVIQLEQLTPAFIGRVMTTAPLSASKAYGAVVYSHFIREAETCHLVLITHNETPASWGEITPRMPTLRLRPSGHPLRHRPCRESRLLVVVGHHIPWPLLLCLPQLSR
jgi:hypothetical protein